MYGIYGQGGTTRLLGVFDHINVVWSRPAAGEFAPPHTKLLRVFYLRAFSDWLDSDLYFHNTSTGTLY